MRAVLMLLALPGCQVLFDVSVTTPAACRHDGLLLCLAFEDETTAGIDSSSSKLEVSTSSVRSVARQDPSTNTDELGLEIDQTSLILISDNEAFDIQAPLSIDLWVFNPGPQPGERILFDNNQQYTVYTQPDRADFTCSFVINGAPVFAGNFFHEPGWRHVACTYDGFEVHAFENGVDLNQPGEKEGTINPDPLPARIGSAGDQNNARPFIGQIDNVRVWTIALTPAQLARFGAGIETE